MPALPFVLAMIVGLVLVQDELVAHHDDLVLADHHVEVPDRAGNQLLWPTSSWIAANEEYASGTHHPGTADLAAAHSTPVTPARDGTVISVGWGHPAGWSGWHVELEHEGDGYTYRTYYGHLLERPLVDEGDEVFAAENGGTTLGYVSRTGNADFSGPHIHFVIRRQADGASGWDTLMVPNLEIGEWVSTGQFIHGDYEGLTELPEEPSRPFDVVVTEPNGLLVYPDTARSRGSAIGEVDAGTKLTVRDSDIGQFEVEYEPGEYGWIPHSGTDPAESTAFGVELTASGATNVRDAANGEVVGQVQHGDLLTAFDTSESGNWHKVQWPCDEITNRSENSADDDSETGGCPAGAEAGRLSNKYGWVHADRATPSDRFLARTRLDPMNVHANQIVDGEEQPDLDTVLGQLEIRTAVLVVGSRNGWYQINYDGQTGWTRGWQTSARQ